jgi:hypothetical protein
VPGSDERAAVQREYAALMPHFRLLLRKTKELVGESRQQQAAHSGLNDMVQQALGLSRLLYDELNRPDSVAEQQFAPATALQQLLADNFEIVERVQVQFQRLAATTNYAAELHQFMSDLIRSGGSAFELVPFRDIQLLVRRIIADVSQESTTGTQPLVPALALAGLSHKYHDPLRAQVYATGIATSQFVVRVARTMWLRDEVIEHLTAAALLQDCGCLILNPELARAHNRPGNAPRILFEQHPGVGAALIGGLRDAPVELGRLIAQHHERPNGRGYPRGCEAIELSDLSRLLAAAVRLEQLRQVHTTPEALLTSQGTADLEAGRRLLSEARRGALDIRMVAKLLSDQDPQLLEASLPDMLDDADVEPQWELFQALCPASERSPFGEMETESGRATTPSGGVPSPALRRMVGNTRRHLVRSSIPTPAAAGRP